MQLVRFDGPDAGGANTSNGVYVYPYYFSIDGSSYPNLTALLCDSYDNEVWQNESWLADQVSLASLVGGPNGQQYIEAAWLFSQMGTHPTPADAAKYNFAVWGLFSINALNSPGYAATGAASVLPTPDQLVGFDYSGYYVYIPIDGTAMLNGQHVRNTPQEYIGYVPPSQTPEPATFALIGTGLFALALKLRRR
jgi:hypothetical protein